MENAEGNNTVTQDLYLICGDASDGIIGQDKSSASVYDVVSWEQVAHWHGYCDPSEFGVILRDMGAFFNWATIAVETNYPGNATYAKLKDLQYPKLWADVETGNPWKTDNRTRPLAITCLREAMRAGTMKINSPATIQEMNTFVRSKSGKYEAESGSHDDCVIESAIAAYILKHTAFTPSALQEVRRKPLNDIIHNLNPRYRPGKQQGIV